MAQKKKPRKSLNTKRTDGRRMKGSFPAPLGRTVTRKVWLPKRKRGPGQYARELAEVLKLKPTTEEMGISPHRELEFKTDDELGRAFRGITAARRRDKQFKGITMRRIRNFEKKKFLLMIWRYN